MSHLCFAAILPHGDVIPELARSSAEATRSTHEAMLEVGRQMAEVCPDTIVIATPHGIRIEDYIGVSLTEFAAGGLQGNGASIIVDMPVDQHMAFVITEEAVGIGIPVVRCVFGTGAGPESRLPLDWGAVIPLWYCGAQWKHKPRIIVVVPSRSVNELELVEFGRVIARAAQRSGKRVALIASCDWAHAQDPAGPYGYHEDAPKFDALVQEVVRGGDLTRFAGLDQTFIENAKPDGIWQSLILAGAIEGSTLKPELLSYQCPTYFGMLVAMFR